MCFVLGAEMFATSCSQHMLMGSLVRGFRMAELAPSINLPQIADLM
jgi:hypothetical protein